MTHWATFTYCGKEVRQINKLFKNTRIKVAVRTQNIINKHIEAPPTKQINTTTAAYIKWNA
jgi:hypothetical protein